MLELTEFQQDAVAELLNIGMGKAAASLSEMVKRKVDLSIPCVEIMLRRHAIEHIRDTVGNEVTAVKETFKGTFWGDAFLLFPESQSLELVRALLQEDALPLDVLSEMEQEALTEVGNIILNACLGSLANIFEQNFHCDLPRYAQGSCDIIFNRNLAAARSADAVLLVRMNFSLKANNIHGLLTLMMDVESMQALTDLINTTFGMID
ncbi:chemotaxis protein CheC [Thalassomonas actiniarum]|uniref:Chemotaxis protein CheC n=1 Tax=Thalassomonas actiniarum TaxID=485447 RepID=A0AAE9YQS9_9GAMM|nr:chemotaxis protein CheC [Thalassomonas actiniarum]WDD98683.1 chemotaxis protein CheC [Thalassomonas actiniarum]